MLFEREPLTPQGRKDVLMRLFGAAARRGGDWAVANHVPVTVLEAHGELATHVRFILDAARHNRTLSREQQRLLHKAERLLDAFAQSNDLTTGYLQKALAKLEQERQALLETQKRRQSRPILPDKLVFADLSFEEKKLVAAQFIRRIDLYENDVTIYWNV